MLQSSLAFVNNFNSSYPEHAMTTENIFVDNNSTDAGSKLNIADWTKHSGRATDDVMYYFHKNRQPDIIFKFPAKQYKEE